MQKQKTSSWMAVVAINLLAIVAVLGVAELGARWLAAPSVSKDDQLPMCRADDLSIWRYRPDVRLTYRAPEFETEIRTNDAGLRQGPILPAAQDIPTVLFIGDSFTFGWGVGEGQRYSEELARALGGRVRIVNAGHWMYTFDQQLVLMKELIAAYRPQVVVQGFYWMHVRTLFNHQLERDGDGALRAVRDPKIQVDERGLLKFRSDWLERPPLGSQLIALVARAVLNRDLRERAADTVDYMRPGSTRDAALWALTDQLIGETSRTLRAAGIAYVPFLIPTSIEVGGTNWLHLNWLNAAPPAGVDIGLPARRMTEMFARHGVEVIDLAKPIRERGGVALYFPNDGHWNAEGHAVAGRLLAEPVRRALATPRP